MSIRSTFRRVRDRRADREAFYLADERAAQVAGQLSHPCDLLDRAALTEDLASCLERMAWLHQAAFGAVPADNGERDMADSLAQSAWLTQHVADAYFGQAGGEPWNNLTADQLAALSVLEHAADAQERAAALEGPAYDAFAGFTGGLAAEVLVALAGAELKAAEPGRKPWKARTYPAWARVTAEAVRLAAATVAALFTGDSVMSAAGYSWTGRALAAAFAVCVFATVIGAAGAFLPVLRERVSRG